MGISKLSLRTWSAGLALLTTITLATGCGDMLHNLQPHRLQRLNRTTDGMSSDAYNWSVPDPIPASELEQPGSTEAADQTPDDPGTPAADSH